MVVDERLLTATGRGGLFRVGYLADRPLETYLDPAEQPRVVFPSKHRGIVHERGAAETIYTPGSGYRALVVITDRRVVMAVGGGAGDGGDEIHDVALDTVDHVAVEQEAGHVAVQYWTGEDEYWECYPDGIDAEVVARRLRNDSQAWIRFERLLSDARTALGEAARHRTRGAFDAARQALDRAEDALVEANETATAYDAPASGMTGRLERVSSRLRDEHRRLTVARGRSVRNQAEDYWRREHYEEAVDHYERARDIFASLRDREDRSPEMTADVERNLAEIDRSLDRLGVAPLHRAIAAQRAAERADEPLAAVEHWRDAFERFREVLWLDWGRENDRFAGERSLLRDRLETVLEGLLIAQQRAADRHFQDAQRLHDEGQTDAALSAAEEARDTIEQAIATANEFTPETHDELHERHAEIESLIETIEDQQQADEHGDRPSESTARDGATLHPNQDTELAGVGTSGPTQSRAHRPDNADAHQDRYVRHLQTLDDSGAALAVGLVWRELGWTVDLLDATGPDAIATRPEDDRSLLLWVRRRGVPVTAASVEALVAARDDREAALSAVLVTTDPVDLSAFEAAMTHGVTLVDSARLGELARQTGVRPDAIDENGD